jgi:hypothetical protein
MKITANLDYCIQQLLFRVKGEIKALHDKQKPQEIMTTKATLQRILKGILHMEEEDK